MTIKALNEHVFDLLSLSKEIKDGKKGVDYLIKADMGWDWTELESRISKTAHNLEKEVRDNSHLLTSEILNNIWTAYKNSHTAFDTSRERTPACGGDHIDLESPLLSVFNSLLGEVSSVIDRLKKDGSQVLDGIDKDIRDWF